MTMYDKMFTLIMQQSVIDSEVSKIGITNNNGFYWYFYALLLDGKPCAKFGSSTVHLGNRIYNYLVKEHDNQTKDWKTFRVICVIKFAKKSCIKHVEGLIKEYAKDHPLHIGQHHNTEQYNLDKVWEQIRDFICAKSFPFAEKVYLIDNPNEVIKKIVCKKLDKDSKPKSQSIVPIKNAIVPKSKEVVQYHKPKKISLDEAILKYINEMDDFRVIPGIGPVLDERLRDEQPFSYLSDIMDVRMIGTEKYNAIENYVKSKAFDKLYHQMAQSSIE